jgi:predicted transcriptional regulator
MQGQTADSVFGEDGSLVITLRVSSDLRDEMQALARQNERTLSAEIRLAMKKHLKTNKVAA